VVLTMFVIFTVTLTSRWNSLELWGRVMLPITMFTWIIQQIFFNCVCMPCLYLICKLLQSDMKEVTSLMKVNQEKEFELDICGVSEVYLEANENFMIYSKTFTRINFLFVIICIWYMLITPLKTILNAINLSLVFCILALFLNVLALPSIHAELLLDTIDKIRPKQSQLSDFLLLKNEIRQCPGAVTIYDFRLTRPKITTLLLKLGLFLLVIKIGINNSQAFMMISSAAL